MVLVDTVVWSLALRRPADRLSDPQLIIVNELKQLIVDGRVLMIGPIRQELLSGIREEQQFNRIRSLLRAFPDEPLTTGDFEAAGSLHNACRSAGMSGSSVDLLLCAVAISRKASVFTTDQDFGRYAAVVPLLLHTPQS